MNTAANTKFVARVTQKVAGFPKGYIAVCARTPAARASLVRRVLRCNPQLRGNIEFVAA